MTSREEKEDRNTLIGKIVGVGTLVTMLSATVGGAFFAANLQATVQNLGDDLDKIEVSIRQVRDSLALTTNGLVEIKATETATLRRVERLENEQDKLRERIRKIENGK